MKIHLHTLICFAWTSFVFGQVPKATKYFEWYKKNYIIQDPRFAHSDTEILFVRQFYIPDGHVAEGREKYVGDLLSKAEKEKRFADPVVCVLNLKTRNLTQLDYGWAPDFSTDDKRIVYSYQTVPISGKRVLAETLNGNKIKIYDRQTKRYETIASPENTFLLDPVFADSVNVIYKTGDAINGAYGGGVAFHQINLLTKKIDTLYPLKKNHGLYHLVGDIYWSNRQIYYPIYIPQDGASWMANKYSRLLLGPPGMVHDFGETSFKNLEGKYAIDDEGNLVFLDDDHQLRAAKNLLVKYKNNELISKKELTFEYEKASVSPNGKYLLYRDDKNSIFLMDTKMFTKIKLPLPQTEIYAVEWSQKSNRFAIVQGHGKLEDTDLISLFNVK